MIEKEKFWYSPIYEKNDYGFFVSKIGSNYFLGYKPKGKNRKATEIKIKFDVFSILRKSWKE